MATLTALSLPGEASVTTATPPSIETSTRPAMARQSTFARDDFVTSVPPPGGNGTFSVVGLFGHACACAGEVIAADDATTIAMKTLMLSP